MQDSSESLEQALQQVCSFLTHLQSFNINRIDASKTEAVLAVTTKALVRMMEKTETVFQETAYLSSTEEFDFDKARADITEKLDKL